jgi:hypothetical protein
MELPEGQFSNALLAQQIQGGRAAVSNAFPNNPEKNSADGKFLGRSFHRRKSR